MVDGELTRTAWPSPASAGGAAFDSCGASISPVPSSSRRIRIGSRRHVDLAPLFHGRDPSRRLCRESALQVHWLLSGPRPFVAPRLDFYPHSCFIITLCSRFMALEKQGCRRTWPWWSTVAAWASVRSRPRAVELGYHVIASTRHVVQKRLPEEPRFPRLSDRPQRTGGPAKLPRRNVGRLGGQRRFDRSAHRLSDDEIMAAPSPPAASLAGMDLPSAVAPFICSWVCLLASIP